MRHVLGLAHFARSNYSRARELLAAALADQRAASGADSLEALQIQIDLARLLVFIDERQQARELLEHAIGHIQQTNGGDHLLAARSFYVLAGVRLRP